MSFWKPGQRQPTSVREDGSSSVKKASLTLSASVKAMKFMQRNEANHESVEEAVSYVQQMDSISAVNNSVPSSSSSRNWQRIENALNILPGRRSFGGCNKFIEKHYDKVIDDLYYTNKKSTAIKPNKLETTDEEILQRYESLVSLPRGPNQGKRKIVDSHNISKQDAKRKTKPRLAE